MREARENISFSEWITNPTPSIRIDTLVSTRAIQRKLDENTLSNISLISKIDSTEVPTG